MIGISLGVSHAEFVERPYCWTNINVNSPRQLDVPMSMGIISFARAGQVCVMTPFTLAGAMAPCHWPVRCCSNMSRCWPRSRWPVLRGLDKVGVTKQQRPVISECVGVPDIIEQIITAAPIGTRVVVAGVCMEPDRFRPTMVINKEIDLRFVVGYGPLEFRDTLHLLADGKVDGLPTRHRQRRTRRRRRRIRALSDPERHAKIVVDPRSTAIAPR